jgi:hypothetical protein
LGPSYFPFVKFSFPVTHTFDGLLCWNWPFSPLNHLTSWITLVLVCISITKSSMCNSYFQSKNLKNRPDNLRFCFWYPSEICSWYIYIHTHYMRYIFEVGWRRGRGWAGLGKEKGRGS